MNTTQQPPGPDRQINDLARHDQKLDETALLVRCDRLGKSYGDFHALTNCSLQVRRRDVFGLLGPNGAGKTTLIRLLLGYLHPTAGTCFVDGINPEDDGVEVRRRVSYLPGEARLPRHMRGAGVLKFFAELHPSGNLQASCEIADRLELNTKTRVAFMSTGMRQKLALSVVFGPATPLLILDEPTANLDPTVRATVLELVGEAHDQGRTVMFSSHVLSEIEETCNRVAFLRGGKLAHELSLGELFQRHRITADRPAKPVQVPDELSDRVTVTEFSMHDDGPPHLRIDTAGDLAPLLSWIESLNLQRIRIEPLGLRAVYDAVHTGQEVTV